MSDNDKPKQIIFLAELVEIDGKKRVMFTRNSDHVPTLDYVVNQLMYDIMELRAIEKAKDEIKQRSKIIKMPGNLIDFLRRGHKR